MLRYRVDGCADLVIPPYRGIGRADELWKTTCCELFVYDGGGRYREFNFSPSGQWAGYVFSGYRNRDGEASLRDWPEIKHDTGASVYVQTIFLPLAIAGGAERAGTGDGDRGRGRAALVLGAGAQWAEARFPRSGLLHCHACGTRRVMKFGIDRLVSEPDLLKQLSGRRASLVAHPASVTADLVHSLDALIAAGVDVTSAFGPQHGLKGDKQDNMVETADETRSRVRHPGFQSLRRSAPSDRPDDGQR